MIEGQNKILMNKYIVFNFYIFKHYFYNLQYNLTINKKNCKHYYSRYKIFMLIKLVVF